MGKGEIHRSAGLSPGDDQLHNARQGLDVLPRREARCQVISDQEPWSALYSISILEDANRVDGVGRAAPLDITGIHDQPILAGNRATQHLQPMVGSQDRSQILVHRLIGRQEDGYVVLQRRSGLFGDEKVAIVHRVERPAQDDRSHDRPSRIGFDRRQVQKQGAQRGQAFVSQRRDAVHPFLGERRAQLP